MKQKEIQGAYNQRWRPMAGYRVMMGILCTDSLSLLRIRKTAITAIHTLSLKMVTKQDDSNVALTSAQDIVDVCSLLIRQPS